MSIFTIIFPRFARTLGRFVKMIESGDLDPPNPRVMD